MENLHSYLAATMAFVFAVGTAVALNRAILANDDQRRWLVLTFSVFVFGSFLRDTAVLFWVTKGGWDHAASYLSATGKGLQLIGILNWVYLSTRESCSHWLWGGMLAGGLAFAGLWDFAT